MWTGTLKQKDRVIEIARLEIKPEIAKPPCGLCKIPSLRLVGLGIPSKFTLVQSSSCTGRSAPCAVTEEFQVTVKSTTVPPNGSYECWTLLRGGGGFSGVFGGSTERFNESFRTRINIRVRDDHVTGDISGDDIPATEFFFSRLRDSKESSAPKDGKGAPRED